MSDNLELDRKTEKLKEPSKRWKNRWLARKALSGYCGTCLHPMSSAAGEEFTTHCGGHDSRDGAVAPANSIAHLFPDFAYLGPIPVDAA